MTFFSKRKPINHFRVSYSNLVFKAQDKLNQIKRFGFFFKQKRIHKWLGLKGEYIVNKELQKLNDSYYVYYDVKVKLDRKTAQIDHIVIGSTGIFIIETKYWSENFKYSYSPFDQLSRSSEIFSKKFNHKIHLRKLLVSVNNSIKYNPSFKDIYVIDSNRLVKHILNSKRVYSRDEVKVLKGIVERV